MRRRHAREATPELTVAVRDVDLRKAAPNWRSWRLNDLRRCTSFDGIDDRCPARSTDLGDRDDLTTDVNATWMPRERRDALIGGDGSPLCQAIATGDVADEYGRTIEDLDFGCLRLSRNQGVKGYCVLICKICVHEPRELAKDQRAWFFGDIVFGALAIERDFELHTSNDQLPGNSLSTCKVISRTGVRVTGSLASRLRRLEARIHLHPSA